MIDPMFTKLCRSYHGKCKIIDEGRSNLNIGKCSELLFLLERIIDSHCHILPLEFFETIEKRCSKDTMVNTRCTKCILTSELCPTVVIERIWRSVLRIRCLCPIKDKVGRDMDDAGFGLTSRLYQILNSTCICPPCCFSFGLCPININKCSAINNNIRLQ